jgi:uncharacterized protein GlcG (DUF336 family)
VVQAVIERAQSMGIASNVAVVDAGVNLKAFGRMDGAFLGSIDVAIRKARTAKLFDMRTEELGAASAPGGPLYGIEQTNGGLVTFGGGTPIADAAGNIIGAVGVSGSTVENDTLLAQVGAGVGA